MADSLKAKKLNTRVTQLLDPDDERYAKVWGQLRVMLYTVDEQAPKASVP